MPDICLIEYRPLSTQLFYDRPDLIRIVRIRINRVSLTVCLIRRTLLLRSVKNLYNEYQYCYFSFLSYFIVCFCICHLCFTLYCNVCAWHALNKSNLLTYLL